MLYNMCKRIVIIYYFDNKTVIIILLIWCISILGQGVRISIMHTITYNYIIIYNVIIKHVFASIAIDKKKT